MLFRTNNYTTRCAGAAFFCSRHSRMAKNSLRFVCLPRSFLTCGKSRCWSNFRSRGFILCPAGTLISWTKGGPVMETRTKGPGSEEFDYRDSIAASWCFSMFNYVNNEAVETPKDFKGLCCFTVLRPPGHELLSLGRSDALQLLCKRGLKRTKVTPHNRWSLRPRSTAWPLMKVSKSSSLRACKASRLSFVALSWRNGWKEMAKEIGRHPACFAWLFLAWSSGSLAVYILIFII